MVFDIPPLDLVLRAVTIYLALLLTLRIFGKRELGQFTLFDLVMILLVANAVQPAITGPDTSLAGGLTLILTMVLTDRALAEGRRRIPLLRTVLESPATPIARDGSWLADAVNREGLDEADLEEALREHVSWLRCSIVATPTPWAISNTAASRADRASIWCR